MQVFQTFRQVFVTSSLIWSTVKSTVSTLLALVNLKPDPHTQREHDGAT